MAFDFKRHLIKVQGGRTYLPVSARIVWFREEHPDWTIETEAVEINHEKQYAIFRARISDAEGRLMATGTKKEDVKGFGDYIEKAETGSVGRALALCGFGTQFSPELDDATGGRFADSPQPMGGGRFGGGGGGNYGNGGGANRYGSPPPQSNGNANGGGNGDGVRFTPPRDSVPSRSAPPAERPPQTRPEPGRNSEAPRAEATRPASAPVAHDSDDNFEDLVNGSAVANTTEDDPFGDEAEPSPKATPAASSGTPACVGCNKALTKAQQELSIRNFGEALCPGCQRDKPRRATMAV